MDRAQDAALLWDLNANSGDHHLQDIAPAVSLTIRRPGVIKVVFCLRRSASLSSREFQTHWFDVHAPLVRKHRHVLRIERYVQLHTDHGPMTERLRAFRGSPEPYDGIAEIWYENLETLEGLGADPAARNASRELKEDEACFIDLAHSPIWIASEREIIPV